MAEIIQDKNTYKFILLNKDDYNRSTLSLIKNYGIYEPGLANFITKFLSHFDCDFFDIGASFGYFSILAAKSISDDHKVYAFEPVFNSFAQMLYNIHLNDVFKKVEIYNVFLSGENNIIITHDSNGMISKDAPVENECISVSRKLNDFNFDRKRIIKLDIEGYEYELLNSNEEIISSDNTVGIITEFYINDDHLKLYNLLVKNGFKYQYILDQDLKYLYEENIKIFNITDVDNSEKLMNVLFLRKEITL